MVGRRFLPSAQFISLIRATDSLDTLKPMLALAMPVLAEESLNLLVGYTDWFLAGRFLPGDEPKAAMGLLAYVMWLLPSLFAFVSIGATAIVARFVGARDWRMASHAASQAVLLGAASVVIAMTLTYFAADQFVAALQLKGRPAELVLSYLGVVLWATPGIMLEYVGTACLRGAGDTKTGLKARIVVNLVNIVLSAGLVTGCGPFPELGWTGLAIGTACGHVCGGAIVLAALLRGRAGLKIFSTEPSRLAIDADLMRRILRVGFPGGCDILAAIVCHLTYVAIINSLGVLSQAAHGLGVQIEAMSYLPGGAFQVAAATLAGQSLGAADPRRAMRGVLTANGAAAILISLVGCVFFFFGEDLALIFTGERTATTVLTGKLLKIVAISTPFHATLMVLTGALRGAGDTRWPLAITFVGLAGFRLPLACLLAWPEVTIPGIDLAIQCANFGVCGAWFAMLLDVVVRSLLLLVRVLRGQWLKARV